jgi:hypothetical protein
MASSRQGAKISAQIQYMLDLTNCAADGEWVFDLDIAVASVTGEVQGLVYPPSRNQANVHPHGDRMLVTV